MLTHQFYENEDDKISLGWKPFPEGYCLIVKHRDGIVHVPLDLRTLTKLKAEIQQKIEEMSDEEQLFNESW